MKDIFHNYSLSLSFSRCSAFSSSLISSSFSLVFFVYLLHNKSTDGAKNSEYVPAITPINKTNENHLRVGTYKASNNRGIAVVSDVYIDRLKLFFTP